MAKVGDLVFLDSIGMVEITWIGAVLAQVKLADGSFDLRSIVNINNALERSRRNTKHYLHSKLLGENRI